MASEQISKSAAGRIIAKYIPRASEVERARATESLHRLARLIIRVHERMERERGPSIREKDASALES